jgi:uncharacterized protein
MSGSVIDYDVPVPMRDGTVLRADVYRPSNRGPKPVLVARTPYDKSDSSELLYLDPWTAVRRGFIVVVQDVRGRYASDGEWQPAVHEALDGADTVAWAARLPGTNGRVGMWGLSYLGSTQWLTASDRPAALKAVAPSFTWCDPADGLVERGGAREHGLMTSWPLFTGFDVLTRRHAEDEAALAERLTALVDDYDALPSRTYWELPAGEPPVYARHGLRPVSAAGAAACDLTSRHPEIALPSLSVAGWFDIFMQGTIDNYLAASRNAPARLLIGPWNHISTLSRQGDVDFGFRANGFAVNLDKSIIDRTLDFLEQHLTDGATAASDDPPVTVFVMGINEWRDLPQWPPAGAVDTHWFLAPGGGLSEARPLDEATAGYKYDPTDPVPTLGGAIYLPDLPAGMFDQQAIESRPDVLTFTSTPLTRDLEVSGRVTATLTTQTDAPSTDWVVRLCDVDERGVSRNVTDGISRVTATPGDDQTLNVDLWSTSNVFLVGHRIRVQVTSSNFPRWDRNTNTGAATEFATQTRVAEQSIRLGGANGSYISLPIVSGT